MKLRGVHRAELGIGDKLTNMHDNRHQTSEINLINKDNKRGSRREAADLSQSRIISLNFIYSSVLEELQ